MEAVSRPSSMLDQVARAAGVSRATASRVFSGSTQVSEAAHVAVERAAAELGYMPSLAASSLAVGRSESVGVVVPEPTSRLFADPMFPRLLRGIGDELSANGLQMVLFAPQSESDVARLEQYLADGHVDAVLLLALRESEPLLLRLHARGIPVVAGGRPRASRAVSFVDVDNHSGGRVATEHLIAQGRRKIAHITGPHQQQVVAERLQGFREATWNAGLRSDLIQHAEDFDRDSGEIAMHQLLAMTHDIDAVFAASDAMAAGALWALQVIGMRVPQDVAVIGFDDSPVAAATQPPLSSVRQPIEEMGREMTRLVLSLSGVHDADPRQVMLGAELAIRGSTVSPN